MHFPLLKRDNEFVFSENCDEPQSLVSVIPMGLCVTPDALRELVMKEGELDAKSARKVAERIYHVLTLLRECHLARACLDLEHVFVVNEPKVNIGRGIKLDPKEHVMCVIYHEVLRGETD